MTAIKPPITWFGGKSRLAKQIVQCFPPHKTYCEPFGGSAAVLLVKSSASVEVYNDIDGNLVNLFQVLRNPETFSVLQEGLEQTFYARAEFELALQDCSDPVEKARRFIVRQRQSFGGHGRRWSYCVADSSGGVASSVKRWRTGLVQLPAIHQRMQSVQIECDDWRTVMERYDTPDTLFYLDPPYLHHTRSAWRYDHDLPTALHHAMLEYIQTVKGKVVLSGYPSPDYSSLERTGWSRTDFHVPAQTSVIRSRRTECLWLSPRAQPFTLDQAVYQPARRTA